MLILEAHGDSLNIHRIVWHVSKIYLWDQLLFGVQFRDTLYEGLEFLISVLYDRVPLLQLNISLLKKTKRKKKKLRISPSIPAQPILVLELTQLGYLLLTRATQTSFKLEWNIN